MPVRKPVSEEICEQCVELDTLPTFKKSLMKVRNLRSHHQVTTWYHRNGHSVFVE